MQLLTPWIKQYRSCDFPGDLTAGVSVAVMLVPQGMAYAMLAGLPPVIGLYAATLPLIVYALIGSSRHLAVGPVAIISLIVLNGVSQLAEPGTEQYFIYVLELTLMVGCLKLAMGLLRMGFLVNFVSKAVISGFTAAAAIIIAMTQLDKLLGLDLPNTHSFFDQIMQVVQVLSSSHGLTVLISATSLGLLLILPRIHKRIPAPLIVVAIWTTLVYLLQLSGKGVSVIGNVPSGFPQLSVPEFSFTAFRSLSTTAMAIMFVGIMESYAIAQSIASREKYKIEPNREFAGLGFANIISAFFSGYPITGGLSRTAVNYASGARSNLAGVISAILILFVLLFLTPVFYFLPKAVLAAIIISAVVNLINFREAVDLFKLKKLDGLTFVITFFITLFIGIEIGILTGIGFSLLVFISRSAYPHMAELGYLKNRGVFLNINRFPEAREFEGVLIFRVDAPMFFANTSFIEKRLHKRLMERPNVTTVVYDLTAVNDIDAVAVGVLEDLIITYEEKGIRFVFADTKGPVRDLLAKAAWDEKFGCVIQYRTLHQIMDEIDPPGWQIGALSSTNINDIGSVNFAIL